MRSRGETSMINDRQERSLYKYKLKIEINK